METKNQIAHILIDTSSGIPFGRLLKNSAAQGWGHSHRSWHCLLEGCQAGPTEPEAPPGRSGTAATLLPERLEGHCSLP